MARVTPEPEAEACTLTPSKTKFSIERARAIKPQYLSLGDGRTLEFWTDGDQTKPAVVLIHGQFQTGNFWIGPPRDDLFLIMPSRPNYGGSSVHKGYTYESFAGDVCKLVDHLKVKRFHILGGSSGGPCAIAIKAILKDRVGKCVVLSGDTENCTLKGGGSQADLMCCAPNSCCGCCLPCCVTTCMIPMMKGMMDSEKMWKNIETGNHKAIGITETELEGWKLLGKDRMIFTVGITKAVMDRDATGPINDWVTESKPWTGKYVEGLANLERVEIWHGEQDSTVPFAAAMHNWKKIPKATIHKIKGCGHDLMALVLEKRLDDFAATEI